MLWFRLAAPLIVLTFAARLPAGQAFLRAAAEANVNQRYLIESVSFAGVELDQVDDTALPPTLRESLASLIGQHCDISVIQNLSAEIRKELHFRTVTEHLSKGTAPDHIKVNFEVVRPDLAFDISLPKFLYHSQQNFTGELDASTRIKKNLITVGILSNGDDLTERFSGITARFESQGLGSDKVRLGVTFDDFHEHWDQATVEAAADTGFDLYRSRWNIAPEVTFALARPVTVSLGTSFQQTESAASGTPNRSANAFTFSARAGHKIEGDVVQQQIEGKYSLRVATRVLGSTYAYARHLISMRYEAKAGKHTGSAELIGGSIAGNAPFFERFVLGSSSTLRGWDRYEIDPLGGSRVAHSEFTYGYRLGEGTVETFYDSGALWHADAGHRDRSSAQFRHSLGVGYKQGIFVLTLAFPLRDGRVEPVFMAGMNY
jgi:hypothetical protein